MKLFNQISLNSWPIYRKLSDQHLGYLLTLSSPAFSVVHQARGGLRGPDAENQG